MKIDTLVLGDFQTNCYVLRSDEQAAECVVIDAGLDGPAMVAFLEKHGLTPVMVLVTHAHVDHIAGVPLLMERWPQLELAVGEGDLVGMSDTTLNLSAMLGQPVRVGPIRRRLGPDDRIEAAGVVLEVRPTPGHTPGSVSFYSPDAEVVFSGDSLFAQSIGRDDFPGGDRETLLAAIKEQLFSLPEQTRVYPGHGPTTTVGYEKRTNPFFQ